MRLEKLAYIFFGNNLVVGSHIKKQLNFLRENVPPGFKYRDMDDLGCGDGKVTLLLKEIFLPRKLRGFDVNPGLVKRTRDRGIEAEVRNLEEDVPRGDLAVLWGVLHHLKDMESCLKKIKENYHLIFIREPVRKGVIRGMELGKPMRAEEINNLAAAYLPGSQTFYCDNNILIFYNQAGADG